MADLDAESAVINTGSVFAPYQEFTYTIPAGGMQQVEYTTDNFALLEVSSVESLEVNFGGAVNQTNFTSGMQYKLNTIVPRIKLFNKGNSSLRVHFALGVGQIRDNRLVVVGQIQTTTTYTSLSVQNMQIGDNGQLLVDVPSQRVVIQNVSANPMRIGAEDGFLISPSGSMDLPLNGAFIIYGSAGDSVVIGVYN